MTDEPRSGRHRRAVRADGPGAAGERQQPPPGGGEPRRKAPAGGREPEQDPPARDGHASLLEEPVARRTPDGWRVGDEEVPDLTSAMVLADLLAAELPTQAMPAVAPAAGPAPGQAGRTSGGARHAEGGARGAAGARHPAGGEVADPKRLLRTVAQLEHALTARIRVEQAIGVLAERHRIRPRQAFELLRSAARARGRRVLEMASEVVDSATNPLLRIPDELAKPPVGRRGRRIARQTLEGG